MPTHYEVLGIPRVASVAEIKRAYRQKALDYHPDKNPHGEAMFKEVTKAYSVLANPADRQAYDAELDREARQQHAGAPARMGRAEQEAFRREEVNLMQKILEQDRELREKAKREGHNYMNRAEFDQWYRDAARRFAGEDSDEVRQRQEERRREEERDRADNAARKRRMKQIEEELLQQKMQQQERERMEQEKAKDRDSEFESLKDDLMRQLKQEEDKFLRFKRELEDKWDARYLEEMERQRDAFRQECSRLRARAQSQGKG